MSTWSTAYVNDLPDSAFACVEGSDRLYPHHDSSGSLDLPHLRAALSRIGDPSNNQCGKAHLDAHAKAEGMGQGKAMLPIKAGPLDPDEEDAFWKGKRPRPLLAIPFGGPIPTPHYERGMDKQGEFFHENTDIFGPYPVLRQTKERLVDWHHSYMPPSSRHGDPFGVMTGVVLGKAILADEPDEYGWWVDFWVQKGQERVALIRRIAERAQLFGSSQPMGRTKIDAKTGSIDVWPFALETLSTSPENTAAVFRSAKAVLDDAETAGIAISSAMRGLLADMRSLEPSLDDPSLAGDHWAKAGRELSGSNEEEIAEAIEALSGGYQRLQAMLERIRAKYRKEPTGSP